ncbi:hypothetical protein NLU13_0245 [Sarocladium strictum]|uniref:BTB domain-containing protein n=1 Tax=Sarocladium strictum TaxID=5046 RepID=A0AA39GNQ6_SARSR|nr:hypothetical protein NLU13_0245 [Sarocladium strictum]
MAMQNAERSSVVEPAEGSSSASNTDLPEDQSELQHLANEALQRSQTTRQLPDRSVVTAWPRPTTPWPRNAPADTPQDREVEIDANGDRFIITHDADGATTTYFVSTKSLELASPFFREIFQMERRNGRSSSPIRLCDRNAKSWAMEPMLRAIHHMPVTGINQSDPEKLADFATHCAAYGCSVALGPWAAGWAYKCEINTSMDVGHLLLAGAIMESNVIKDMAMEHVGLVNPHEVQHHWQGDSSLAEIPSEIVHELMRIVTEKIERILCLLKTALDGLNAADGFVHYYHACPDCGACTEHPPADSSGSEEGGVYCEFLAECEVHDSILACTSADRLDAMLGLLRDAKTGVRELSGSAYAPQEMTENLLNEITLLNYRCPDREHCPFWIEMEDFEAALQEV